MKDLNKKDWELVKLGDVLEYIQPTKFIVESDQYNDTYTIPVLTAGKSFILGYTNETKNIFDDLPVIIFDDFTTAIKFVDFPFKVKSSAMKILVPKKNICDVRFVFYKMLTIKTTSSEHKRYWISKYSQIQIPLPPLSTQKYIAQILDKADALRKKDQQLLQYYDDLSQSLFINLFGDPVKNEKGWKVKKLGEVCDKITDGTHFSPPSLDSGIPYVTAKHLKENFIDFYSKPTYISIEEHKEIYKRCTPEYGDVLYIKDGATTGIAAINKFDFEFSMLSSLALIKVKKETLNNFYLSHWLNNQDVKEKYIREFMAGAAIRRFTLDKMKRFEILVPPIELQNQFTQQIQNIEKQKEKVKAQMQASEETFQSLLQQVFN